jgi:DNA-binding NarL/FixJ family response regulator
LSPIRVLVVDDHPIVLKGLSDLFETQEDLEVVGTCVTGQEALAQIGDLAPDVAILDLRLPDVDGIEVLRRLKEQGFGGRAIFLTAQMEAEEALEAIRLGAQGIVFKDQAPEDLVRAVREVARGGRWLPQGITERALDVALRRETVRADPARALSARETEVCRLVGRGYSNKRVARELKISEGTVKVHLNNIFQKLGVTSRLQVALAAKNRGLV